MVWSGLVDLVLAKPLFLKVKMNSIFTKQVMDKSPSVFYCVSNKQTVDVVFIPSSIEKTLAVAMLSATHAHILIK